MDEKDMSIESNDNMSHQPDDPMAHNGAEMRPTEDMPVIDYRSPAAAPTMPQPRSEHGSAEGMGVDPTMPRHSFAAPRSVETTPAAAGMGQKSDSMTSGIDLPQSKGESRPYETNRSGGHGSTSAYGYGSSETPQPTQPNPYGAVPPQPYEQPKAGKKDKKEKSSSKWGWGIGGLAVGAVAAGLVTALVLGSGTISLPNHDDDGRHDTSVTAVDERSGNKDDSQSPVATSPKDIDGDTDVTLATRVAERCLPSVVSVHAADATTEGLGSGVIMDEAGHIITNSHVVKDMTQIVVVTGDGNEYDAKVLGLDDSSDLAVLDVEWNGATITPMEWGVSADLKVGAWVMTLGSPYGLDQSVSTGIVSALSRDQLLSSYDGYRIYANLIQTDAAINMGNSGGALVNSEGQLVGINSILVSSSGSNAGIGFAIPSDYAKRVYDQIVDTGEAHHAYLGGRFADVSKLTAGQPQQEVVDDGGHVVDTTQDMTGALVDSVSKDGPADKAGIQAGDIITQIGDDKITSSSSLVIAVRTHNIGEEVDVKFIRDGKEQSVKVTLGSDADAETAADETTHGNGAIGGGQGQGGQGQGNGPGGNGYGMSEQELEELQEFMRQFAFPFGNDFGY